MSIACQGMNLGDAYAWAGRWCPYRGWTCKYRSAA